MTTGNAGLHWIANYIWGIADDVLRDLYVRGKYRDVILPMGSIFEELVRRFNEENNEEAGEHWTPRDAVRLMARLVFLPAADAIRSGTYLLYDGACGTGGMLTVAEETLRQTLANDAFPAREFDFMLSNPPYGKSWKTDLERLGGRQALRDPRFVIEHAGDPEYSLVTRSSDGQMLFLANKLSKMKRRTRLGSRIAEAHNGSSLFTGDAGQGESNIRRWIIENDWLEAIVALPLNLFYNTGIATYVWVLTNRKPERRRGKVQLIDATPWRRPLRKNLGKKTCELGEDDAVKVGYEISFTRWFHKPPPLRSLAEIRADVLALEKETEGLLAEIVGGTAFSIERAGEKR